MAQTKNPTTLAAWQGSNSKVIQAENFEAEPTTLALHIQGEINVVTILAARSRVAPWVVRAHIEAFGFGGAS